MTGKHRDKTGWQAVEMICISVFACLPDNKELVPISLLLYGRMDQPAGQAIHEAREADRHLLGNSLP